MSTEMVQPRAAFGLCGAALDFLDENHLVVPVANGFMLLRMDDMKEWKFVWSGGLGVTAVALCVRRQLLAYSTRRVKDGVASVVIYDLENEVEKVTLAERTGSEYAALAFSRYGDLLVAVGKSPDQDVSVWEWEGLSVAEQVHEEPTDFADLNQPREPRPEPGTPQLLSKLTLPSHISCSRVSVCPTDYKKLVCMGQGRMCFVNLMKTHTSYDMKAVEAQMTGEDTNKTRFGATCWAPDGYLYAGGLEGQLCIFDTETGHTLDMDEEVICTLTDFGAINTMLLTKTHLVTGGQDGFLRWTSLEDYTICLKCNIGAGNILSCMQYPDNKNMYLLSTDTGKLMTCETIKQPVTKQGLEGGKVIPGQEPRRRNKFAKEEKMCEVDMIRDYHAGSVTGMCVLRQPATMATCGMDGTLRVWDYEDVQLVNKIAFGTQHVCMDASPAFDVVALGSVNGVVRIVDLSVVASPKLIYRKRVFDQPVSAAKWHPTGKYLVVGSQSGTVAFISGDTTHSNGPYPILGVINAPRPVLDISWSGTSSLLVLFEEGVVYRLTPPPTLYDPAEDGLELSEATLHPVAFRIPMAPRSIISKPSGLFDDRDIFFAVGKDKVMKQYEVPKRAKTPDTVWSARTVIAPLQKFAGHDKIAGCVVKSYDGQLVASSGEDGYVIVRKADYIEQPHKVAIHDGTLGGGISMCISYDSRFLFSAGSDGSIVQYELSFPVSGAEYFDDAADEVKPYEVESLDDTEDTEVEPIELLQRAARASEEVGDEDGLEDSRNRTRIDIYKLKEKFQTLMKKNMEAEDIEKLDRMEFVVDKEMHSRMVQEADENVNKTQQEIRFANLSVELLRERIKEQCWDSMKEQGTALHGFETTTIVQNFPLRKLPPEVERRWKVASMLRSVETSLEESEDHAEDEKAASGDAGGDAAAGDGEGAEGDKNPADEEEEEDAVKETKRPDAKYNHAELFTRNRKIVQVMLLTAQVREVQEKFNQEFAQLHSQKHDDLEKINERRERVVAIQQELQQEPSVRPVGLADDEMPENTLDVEDKEVPVQKYVSQAEREREEAARLAEEERKKKELGENIYERALKQMMGGTLEKKKKGGLFDDPVKPEWMDQLAEEEMSEEQKQQKKEFDEKLKAIIEEREKMVKNLEGEIKKLNLEASEIIADFDNKLNALYEKRLSLQASIYQSELEKIRIVHTILRQEEDVVTEDRLSKEAEEAEEDMEKKARLLREFQDEYNEFKNNYEMEVAEDKALEKSFKKDHAMFEGQVDAMFKLFKKRKRTPGDAERASMDGAMDDPNDPYATKATGGRFLALAEEPDELDDFDQEAANIDEDAWNEVVRTRNEKIELENRLKKQSETLNEMTVHLEMLGEEYEEARAKNDYSQAMFTQFQEERQRDLRNLALTLTVKQGQLEVEEAAVVTDFRDALLIDKSVVEVLNDEIKVQGGEKVTILEEIKEFRRGIIELEWENERLEMLADDLNQKISSIQLLRVTKNIQEVIRRGDDTLQQQEIATLENLISHGRKSQVEKLAALRREYKKIQKLIGVKKLENTKLDGHVDVLDSSVKARQKIVSFQEGGGKGGPASEDDKKMKNLVTRRKLVELAKMQADEIDFLREELDRLRQRTFPSFQSVQNRQHRAVD